MIVDRIRQGRYQFQFHLYTGINPNMMMTQTTGQRRELGDFVRSLRERLTPQEAGLPAGQRRRTPGLRREEAALLAGLSVTWYTWLEQGREISLSPQALARLASALRLGRSARAPLSR